MQLKNITLKFTGTRPLIMQSAEGMDMRAPTAEKRYDLNALIKLARKKEDNFAEILRLQQESMRLDWGAGIYHDEGGFYVPADNVIKSLSEGAGGPKARKEIIGKCMITEDRIRVGGFPIHKTLDAYYADQQFRLETTIRVPPRTGSRNFTAKAMLPNHWTLQFTIEFDPSVAGERLPPPPNRRAPVSASAGGGRSLGGFSSRRSEMKEEI